MAVLARAGIGLLWLESGPVGLWVRSPAAGLVPGAGLSSNPPLQRTAAPVFWPRRVKSCWGPRPLNLSLGIVMKTLASLIIAIVSLLLTTSFKMVGAGEKRPTVQRGKAQSVGP
jgi:hypothetical protein